MIIYKTTNLLNGKIYIGQDSKNKPTYLGSGFILKRAIKKYGVHNFKKEIIDTASSKEELDEKEKYWIRTLDSLQPNGYNLCEGGQGGFLGVAVRAKAKESVKEYNRKNPMAHKGENNGRYDRTKYEFINIESLEIILCTTYDLSLKTGIRSNALKAVAKGYRKSINKWMLKKVYDDVMSQYDTKYSKLFLCKIYIDMVNDKTGEEYSGSIADMKKYHEVKTALITQIYKKNIKSANGWRLK